ncbi:MAG: CoB--CoM heterodisulfide reductase subunit B [Candidatus Lokiarchaeota archaeon]|nr:CoB--CoM heterodisulfide reductase subunit B [Candidatus Lokiarchaeota archaeon]
MTASAPAKDIVRDYDLYLGCVAPNRYPQIEAATQLVFQKLGITLHDMKGASCCPAPGVFRGFDIPTWLAIAARNITIAEQDKRDAVIMCNGCYGTLLEANHIMKTEPERRKATNDVLAKVNREFRGTVRMRHIIEVLYNDVGVPAVADLCVNPLRGIKAAVHYGCHLLKPSETRPWGKDERPTFFDELVEATGAESVDYKDKYMCCGAGGGVRTAVKEVSLDFTREKLVNIKEAGADIIVDCCPFCHLQFDLGQVEVKQIFQQEFTIPVIYYTQLLGLAMGLSPYELGLLPAADKPAGTSPFISTKPFMDKVLSNMK